MTGQVRTLGFVACPTPEKHYLRLHLIRSFNTLLKDSNHLYLAQRAKDRPTRPVRHRACTTLQATPCHRAPARITHRPLLEEHKSARSKSNWLRGRLVRSN